MQSYSIEFRILSKNDFDLEEITATLGLEPTNTRKCGEEKALGKIYLETMWGFSTPPNKEWVSIEKGLIILLKTLYPLKEKINRYAKKYDVILWCGYFTTSFDGGPTFTPNILKQLGDFGVELFIDTYFCTKESVKNSDPLEADIVLAKEFP